MHLSIWIKIEKEQPQIETDLRDTDKCPNGPPFARIPGVAFQVGRIYRLSARVRPGICAGVGRALEYGPSRNQAKSLAPRGPEPDSLRGLILTQIVRLAACPFAIKDTRIGSCFVSPSQYGLALYQRWTTLGSTFAVKILGASSTHLAVPAPLSNWLAISIRINVTDASVSVKRKVRGSLVLSCAATIIDSRLARTEIVPCSALSGAPLACPGAVNTKTAPTRAAIAPIVPRSISVTTTGSTLT